MVDDLLGPCAERCVVVTGGTCSQLQAQLHCQTALEQEDGLAVLIANPVEYGGDDHGVEPPLQPRWRHASVGGVVADEPLQVTDVAWQLLDVVTHCGQPEAGDAERPTALRSAW